MGAYQFWAMTLLPRGLRIFFEDVLGRTGWRIARRFFFCSSRPIVRGLRSCSGWERVQDGRDGTALGSMRSPKRCETGGPTLNFLVVGLIDKTFKTPGGEGPFEDRTYKYSCTVYTMPDRAQKITRYFSHTIVLFSHHAATPSRNA